MGLLDVFVERKDKPDKPKKKPNLAAIGIPQDGPMANLKMIPSPMYNTNTDEENEIIKQLKNELKTNNKYSIFVATKNAMAALPSDELKYTSAFAALSIGGLTKDELISSAKDCQTKVIKEGRDFETGYQAAYNEQVENLKKTMEAKSTELATLEQKIQTAKSQFDELERNSNQAAQRLNSKREAFQKAVTAVGTEVELEISNINQYIK